MSAWKALLAILFLIISPLFLQGVGLSQSIPFETIDEGEISHFGYSDPNFLGADMVIRDAKTWEWFWKRHTQGTVPPSPLPKVNFSKYMVLVAILGHQTSGGGPSIEISSIKGLWNLDSVTTVRIGVPKGIAAIVEENREPGPLDVITNPFHVVKVKIYASVIFEHQRTGGPCTDNSDCEEGEYCRKKVGDCEGSGICRKFRPLACTQVYDPVCGCDGKTYPNLCEAYAGGVSILHAGECAQTVK